MLKLVHMFISDATTIIPRWRAAFPDAEYHSHDEPAIVHADIVWVHLRPKVRVAEQLSAVRAKFGNSSVVVLSDEPNDDQAIAAFSAGAKGYANSHASSEILQRIAEVVQQGGLWIGESLMQRLVLAVGKLPSPVEPLANGRRWADKLTERELQVAKSVAAGASNKEVARELDITERTVKAHVSAIFDKLGTRDRLQLSLLVNQAV